MEPLILAGTEDTPDVYFNDEQGVFKISGNSFSDDPFTTFSPIFNWLDIYFQNPLKETHVEIKMSYLNTASSKQITEILFKFQTIIEKSDVKILWYYDKLDEDMEFEGQTLKHIVSNLNFEMVGY